MNLTLSEKKRIFIVDDNQEHQEMTKEILYKKFADSIRVINSDSELDSKRRLSLQKFDVIILDLNLGKGGNGASVLDFIRNKNEFNKETPIIICSGEVNKDFIQEFNKEVFKIWVKPLNWENRLEDLENLFNRSV